MMNSTMLKTAQYKGFTYHVRKMGILSDMQWHCGYVEIPENHPYYEKGYDDVDVDVHGGLTFSGWLFEILDEDNEAYAFSFDTAHGYDTPETTNNPQYVEEQCKHLIDQLVEVQHVRTK